MRIVLFNGGNVGLLLDNGVINLSDNLKPLKNLTGQLAINTLIADPNNLKSRIDEMKNSGKLISLDEVKLEAPLPLPNKILCMGGNSNQTGSYRYCSVDYHHPKLTNRYKICCSLA